MKIRSHHALLVTGLLLSRPAFAQTPPATHVHQMPAAEPGTSAEGGREASGTAWLPDNTPMSGAMWHPASWMLMLHGNLHLQYVRVSGDRGDDQFGSINWLMAMASRPVGAGTLTLRAMASVEPLTVGRCGYPDLAQSGESCRGQALHGRQHPHDLVMELAARYVRPISHGVSLELYGGPAGEPALGPVAYPHRPSAMAQPLAPVSHHWLDATHVTFGVATVGVAGHRWKIEGSVFNGREPDDARYGLDVARMDSTSARAWWLPNRELAIQASFGVLRGAHHGDDVHRATSSLMWHRESGGRMWWNTVAWGVNLDAEADSHALLVESAVDLTPTDTIAMRLEVVSKTAGDLALVGDPHRAFTIAKVQGTYTRWGAPKFGLRPGAGFGVGFARMPAAIVTAYGSRMPAEMSVFLTLGPARAR